MDCKLNVRSDSGQLWLDLVRGGRHYRCGFDIATGQAALEIIAPNAHEKPQFVSRDGERSEQPMAESRLRGAGKYRVLMANVDRRLSVWVNGKKAPV